MSQIPSVSCHIERCKIFYTCFTRLTLTSFVYKRLNELSYQQQRSIRFNIHAYMFLYLHVSRAIFENRYFSTRIDVYARETLSAVVIHSENQ